MPLCRLTRSQGCHQHGDGTHVHTYRQILFTARHTLYDTIKRQRAKTSESTTLSFLCHCFVGQFFPRPQRETPTTGGVAPSLPRPGRSDCPQCRCAASAAGAGSSGRKTCAAGEASASPRRLLDRPSSRHPRRPLRDPAPREEAAIHHTSGCAPSPQPLSTSLTRAPCAQPLQQPVKCSPATSGSCSQWISFFFLRGMAITRST